MAFWKLKGWISFIERHMDRKYLSEMTDCLLENNIVSPSAPKLPLLPVLYEGTNFKSCHERKMHTKIRLLSIWSNHYNKKTLWKYLNLSNTHAFSYNRLFNDINVWTQSKSDLQKVTTVQVRPYKTVFQILIILKARISSKLELGSSSQLQIMILEYLIT